jgi:hypothetical protein
MDATLTPVDELGPPPAYQPPPTAQRTRSADGSLSPPRRSRAASRAAPLAGPATLVKLGPLAMPVWTHCPHCKRRIQTMVYDGAPCGCCCLGAVLGVCLSFVCGPSGILGAACCGYHGSYRHYCPSCLKRIYSSMVVGDGQILGRGSG